MTITAPPTIPLITDPSTFSERAQDWVVWQAEQLYPELTSVSLALGLSLSATSVTSNTVGTGSKSFTVETGKGLLPGQSIVIARTAAPTNRMFGIVTSYNSGTGALVFESQAFEGSGTFTDWTISPTLNAVLTLVQVPDLLITNAKLANAYINNLTAVTFDHAVDYVAIGDASDSGNKKKALISTSKIQPITASVAANALTLTLNPTALDFRDATLTIGTVNTRTVPTAISLVISSGSTLGTVNAIQSRIAVLAIDNAGTVELAAVNIAGGTNLTETGVISTTAEGGAGAADSASVIYSTTARTNVAYRVVGYIESTQATAGTWGTAPSTIQGVGGQALAAMSSLGYGQTWQDLTGSRAAATTYYNTSGKPIFLSIYCTGSAALTNYINVNGLAVSAMSLNTATNTFGQTSIIPASGNYSVTLNTGAITKWFELR